MTFEGLELEERAAQNISVTEAALSDDIIEDDRVDIMGDFVKHVSMEVIRLADQVVNISTEDQIDSQEVVAKEDIEDTKSEAVEQSTKHTEEDTLILEEAICPDKKVIETEESKLPIESLKEDLEGVGVSSRSPPKREASNLSLRKMSREASNLSQSGISGLNREPSFIYDTTVEAFSCEGASVDDILDDMQSTEGQDDVTGGISIIGKLVLSLDNLGDSDKAADEDKKTKVSVTALSTSPTRMETVFLTESGEEQEATSGIEIPERRVPDESTEGKISTTPEAEAYFMKREQSFINKVYTGEVHNLAVNVSNFNALDTSMSESDLTVKPVAATCPEMEIEVSSLNTSRSELTVKPMKSRGLMSSYEAIYDRVSIEDLDHIPDQMMTTSDLLDNLGDRFEGTRMVPEHASSFEDLYERSADNMAGDILSSALDTLEPARWSAPAGSIEPPILEAEEFSIRFDPVAERIQGHWQELEILLEGGG